MAPLHEHVTNKKIESCTSKSKNIKQLTLTQSKNKKKGAKNVVCSFGQIVKQLLIFFVSCFVFTRHDKRLARPRSDYTPKHQFITFTVTHSAVYISGAFSVQLANLNVY